MMLNRKRTETREPTENRSRQGRLGEEFDARKKENSHNKGKETEMPINWPARPTKAGHKGEMHERLRRDSTNMSMHGRTAKGKKIQFNPVLVDRGVAASSKTPKSTHNNLRA